MEVYIPTAGRWNDQPTLNALDAAGLSTTLVVQQSQEHQYDAWNRPMLVLPPDIVTIAPTRQFILENSKGNFVMLDDDLTFAQRRDDDPTKLRELLPRELAMAFAHFEDQLQTFSHVGFASREGANRNTGQYSSNTRIMRVLGYQGDKLKELGIRFDRLEVMEDFDVALQLLELGLPNRVLNRWTHNQAGSGKSGGCSTFRTPALQAANAAKLKALHPKFVKVVQKTTKGAWGGGTRTDVNIQWKKAFGSSQ